MFLAGIFKAQAEKHQFVAITLAQADLDVVTGYVKKRALFRSTAPSVAESRQ